MLDCPQISLADGVNLGLEGPGTWQGPWNSWLLWKNVWEATPDFLLLFFFSSLQGFHFCSKAI